MATSAKVPMVQWTAAAALALVAASCRSEKQPADLAPSILPAPFHASQDVESLDLPADVSRYLDELRTAATTARVEVVRFDSAALDAGVLALPTTADGTASCRRLDYVEIAAAKTWAGSFLDIEGEAILTVRDGECTGFIRTLDGLILVRPIGSGLHALVSQDETSAPPDHPPGEVGPPAGTEDERSEDSSFDQPTDAEVEVTLLVAYTPAVVQRMSREANVLGLIDASVEATNQSFRHSRVLAKVRVVGTLPVSYSESASHRIDVSRLATPADGHMDEVHSARAQSHADVVVLIVDSPLACGYAAAIKAQRETAFAVVHYGCADGYFSFAHELGHLFGARHDHENDPDSKPYAYGHGYRLPGKRWRTIMSYDCSPGCSRIGYWSTPDAAYGGDPMGTRDLNDNARVLTERRHDMAGFY